MMPTRIVLTFDQALDAVTAEDARDYRIIGPAGRTIAIKSAVYDPANLTVTLRPVERISIHHRYKLIIDGTAPHGLANTGGQLLDGSDEGRPDSDDRAPLTWRNLVLDPPWPRVSHRSQPSFQAAESSVSRDPARKLGEGGTLPGQNPLSETPRPAGPVR